MSRLAEIYKREKSRGGGLASTLTKRSLEKFDPRQMFDQSGLMAALFPSVFKSYSATSSKSGKSTPTGKVTIENISNQGLESRLDLLTSETSIIRINSQIFAKNSVVLPAMSRDMNLVRQNIAKLVKLQGKTPAYKADMFFRTAKERENQYEEQFKRERGSTTRNATKVGETDASGGLLGGLTKGISGLGSGIGLAALGAGIGGFIAGIGLGGAAINTLGGASGIKDLLVNLGDGLSAFSGRDLTALGALLGTGALFGAVTGPIAAANRGLGAATGMGMIGAGIGAFLSGISGADWIVEKIGADGSQIKNIMVNLAEGLGAFSSRDFTGLSALIIGGGAIGAVIGPAGSAIAGAGAATLLGALGLSIGAFFTGLSAGNWAIDKIGTDGSGIKNIMKNLAEGLSSFSNLDGSNIAAIGKSLPSFALGLAGLFGGDLWDKFTDKVKAGWDWIFGGEKQVDPKQSLFAKLADQLKYFEDLQGFNIEAIGKGFSSIVDSLFKYNEFSKKKENFETLDNLYVKLKNIQDINSEKISKAGDSIGNLSNNLKKLTEFTDADLQKIAVVTQTMNQMNNAAPSVTSSIKGWISDKLNRKPSPTSAAQQSVPSKAQIGISTSPSKLDAGNIGNLTNLIYRGEGTSHDIAMSKGFGSGYDVPYAYGLYAMPEKPLSQMTIAEVKSFQKKQIDATRGKVPGTTEGTGAVGIGQFTQGTLNFLQKQMGFGNQEIFSPELQDQMVQTLLMRRGLKDFQSGKIGPEQFQENLAREWASIGSPKTGSSLYEQPTNVVATQGLQQLLSGQPARPASNIQAASSSYNDQIMGMMRAAPTIVDSSTTNNIQNTTQQSGSQNVSASVVDSEFMKMLLNRAM